MLNKSTPHYYRERTPKALNAVLLQTSYFKENWKKILPTFKLLRMINHWNESDRETKGASEITRTVFSNVYGTNYTQAVLALETAGLVTVSRVWTVGHCYQYLLTNKGQAVLTDATQEYLHKILTDPKEKRRIIRSASERGYTSKVYGDVRDHHKEVIDSISFDEDDIERVCNKYSEAKANCVRSLLINIIEKDYSDLKYNQKDNRIWTPYLQLPAEIKAVIKVKGLQYLGTMDIRSCYPSCWARYVSSLCSPSKSLQEEMRRYEDLFLNKDRDPKTILSMELGIDRDEIKEVMIKYFNGYNVSKRKKDPFRLFDAYLQEQYPLLYTEWKKTDIKQTGNNIGKMFETRLMHDQSIYDKADELGMILGYEYDGMSFYGEKESDQNELMDYIQERSCDLLGFNLVLVQKNNRELLEHLSAKSQVEQIFEEVQENDKTLASKRHA